MPSTYKRCQLSIFAVAHCRRNTETVAVVSSSRTFCTITDSNSSHVLDSLPFLGMFVASKKYEVEKEDHSIYTVGGTSDA